jgi:hypothetical protein
MGAFADIARDKINPLQWAGLLPERGGQRTAIDDAYWQLMRALKGDRMMG